MHEGIRQKLSTSKVIHLGEEDLEDITTDATSSIKKLKTSPLSMKILPDSKIVISKKTRLSANPEFAKSTKFTTKFREIKSTVPLSKTKTTIQNLEYKTHCVENSKISNVEHSTW